MPLVWALCRYGVCPDAFLVSCACLAFYGPCVKSAATLPSVAGRCNRRSCATGLITFLRVKLWRKANSFELWSSSSSAISFAREIAGTDNKNCAHVWCGYRKQFCFKCRSFMDPSCSTYSSNSCHTSHVLTRGVRLQFLRGSGTNVGCMLICGVLCKTSSLQLLLPGTTVRFAGNFPERVAFVYMLQQ